MPPPSDRMPPHHLHQHHPHSYSGPANGGPPPSGGPGPIGGSNYAPMIPSSSSSHSHPMSHHPSHHLSSRHVSGGPPQPLIVSGGLPPSAGPPPPGMAMGMGGPPPPQEAMGPGPGPGGPVGGGQVVMGNGHSHNGHSSVSPAVRAAKEKMDSVLAQLATANENTWMLIGAVSEQMQDQDKALSAFEHALRHNPMSILGLNAVASIARSRDDFNKAIEYFQRILNIKQDNGEVWGSMGHCLLMKDDLPKAYTAYQQALYHLPNPKEPKLWYGIGILYDRYGSFEHAEEAFSSVLKMDPNFEKANEIYFRLGIIYKHQRKYPASLECFRYILNNPPRPLTAWDIWFQLGHVHEQDHDYVAARDAYNRVLQHQPDHAKVLQQLGWLYHQPGASFANQDMAVSYLTKSLETDGTDAQSWYLLGRAFMAGQRYNKAYEAYQQAVYRDGRNPTFWCSIGVLYYQINQYRDALDAYSRAIRLNPYISEVWFNLGSLYESCNNQITDAIDAYSRAAELDPTNRDIKARLTALQTAQTTGAPPSTAPAPIDVHPSQYSATPQGTNYQPGSGSPGESPRLPQAQVGPDAPPQGGRDLPPPPPGGEFARGGHSPGPFRGGGAPPPLAHVDESRGAMGSHAPLAPIDTDAPSRASRDSRDSRDPRDVRDPRDSRDPRDVREPYRDGPHFNGVNNGPSRYDPTNDAPSRRHAASPGSPRRRTDGFPPPPGYPYNAHPNSSLPSFPPSRDREREEWERSRGGPGSRHGGNGGPPLDPRQPSPRMMDRISHPSQDTRRQPSPRMPQDYRSDYGRPPPNDNAFGPYSAERGHLPPGYPGTGSDSRGYDLKRERDQERRDDRGDPANVGNGSRMPSASRDRLPTEDIRAPSPAPSSSSKTGTKRKSDKKEESDKNGSVSSASSKRQKEDVKDKNAGKKSSGGEKKGSGSLKITLSRGSNGATPSVVGAEDEVGSPRNTNGSSPAQSSRGHQTPLQTSQVPIPPRAVDEDYDEGAADALMFLHSDRGSIDSKDKDSVTATNKRPDPPSPTSPQTAKKAKASASPNIASPKPSPTRSNSERVRTVIEVLNAPRIGSPLPPLSNASKSGVTEEKKAEDEGDKNDVEGQVPEITQDQAGVEAPSADVRKTPERISKSISPKPVEKEVVDQGKSEQIVHPASPVSTLPKTVPDTKALTSDKPIPTEEEAAPVDRAADKGAAPEVVGGRVDEDVIMAEAPNKEGGAAVETASEGVVVEGEK